MHKETSQFISHIVSSMRNFYEYTRVGNMYWEHFLEDYFYYYSQPIIYAVANESLIPYNLIKMAPCFFMDRELLFIELNFDTYTK